MTSEEFARNDPAGIEWRAAGPNDCLVAATTTAASYGRLRRRCQGVARSRLQARVRSRPFTGIEGQTFGYTYTHAFGINDFGSIVGDCDIADGYVSAYVLRRGNFTIIDAPGAVATTAWDINNRGAIVGDYYGDDDRYHGFLYVDGKLTTIDFPGAVHTSAQGIDDFGRVVGIFVDDTDTWRGFVLAGGKFRAIEPPNAGFTTAVGIRARTSWATWRSTAFQVAMS